MRTIWSLIVLLLSASTTVSAQGALPKAVNDSLWAVWNDTRQADTSRLMAIQRIAWEGHVYAQPDSAYHFAQMQYDLAMRTEQKKFAALALHTQGGSFYVRGDFEKALDHFGRSFKLKEEMGDRKDMATSLLNMGLIYKEQGNHVRAMDLYMRSLKLFEETGHKPGITASLNNIGIIYQDQKEYRNAMEHYARSLKIQRETNNKQGLVGTLNNMGIALAAIGDTTEALIHYNEALAVMEEIGDRYSAASCLTNIGVLYFGKGEVDKAMEYQHRALVIKRELGDQQGTATSLINIGDIHLVKGDHGKAIGHAAEALQIAQEIGAVMQVEHAAYVLYASYKASGQHAKALEMHELHIAMRDSIESVENQREVMRQQMQYDYDKKEALTALEQEKKDAIATEQLRRREVYLAAAAGITFLLGIIALMAFFAYRAKAKVNVILENKNHLIGEQKKEITDSIQYAENIQRSLLPQTDVLRASFPDSFILFRPKDIVSGDFYWMAERNGTVFLAVGDCTGHGVPGAMLSVIGLNSLNRCISDLGLFRPKDVLMQMTLDLLVTFEGAGAQVRDGMDIALCAIDLKARTLTYAGANNPLWIARNGEMLVLKAARRAVGFHDGVTAFTQEETALQQGDAIYLSSDGFQDQMGGPSGKKYMTRRFRELLQSTSTLPMDGQHRAILQEFTTWKGDCEQTDDVCVMGVRV